MIITVFFFQLKWQDLIGTSSQQSNHDATTREPSALINKTIQISDHHQSLILQDISQNTHHCMIFTTTFCAFLWHPDMQKDASR